ncbi:MAG: hypothetical protein K0S93_87 [Nitrososphaeraceae archaeon]|nr:hypothetical protein [Nitrososphaeraceae archaeon]
MEMTEMTDCEDCEYYFNTRDAFVHVYIGDVKVIIIACPKHREEAYQNLKDLRKTKEENDQLKLALKELLK